MVSPGGANSAIVECESDDIVGGPGNMPIYAKDVFGLFIAGCRINNGGGGEYNIRYQGGTEGIITNITLEHCGDSKNMMTIRGDSEHNYIAGRHVVNDNYFDGSSCISLSFHVTIVPQNRTVYEPIKDVIYERNYHNADTSSGSNLLNINARFITVRNNLFDSTGGGQKSMITIDWSHNGAGLPVPSDIHIYNNSFFKNSDAGATGVALMEGGGVPKDCIIKNNFMYAPNSTINGSGFGLGAYLCVDFGLDTVISSNTKNYSVDETQIKDVFSHFTVQPPSDDPNDWILFSGSYAADVGEEVPVWSDFFRSPIYRSTSRNLGAILIE